MSGSRILLAAGECGARNSGLGVYAYEVARRIVPRLIDAGHAVELAVRADAQALIDSASASGAKIRRMLPSDRSAPVKLYDYFSVLADASRDCDLVYSLDYKLPLRAAVAKRSIITIHDCCHLEVPQEYGRFRKAFYYSSQAILSHSANRIATVSNNAKQCLMKHYHIRDRKIVVAYNGVGTALVAPGDEAAALNEYPLPKRFFLVVGAFAPRKNLGLIAKAVYQLRQQGRDFRVVVVGGGNIRDTHFKQYVQDKGLNDCFVFFGHVSDAALSALYRRSVALLYPSLCEGFGIPVIEALRLGVPAIVAKTAVGAEIGAEFVMTVDPHDERDLADAMMRVETGGWTWPPGIEQHLSQFSWDSSVDILYEMVDGLLTDRRK